MEYTVIVHKNRAWQRKLYALVQDGNNCEELYKCLHMLLTTTEENTFSDLLGKLFPPGEARSLPLLSTLRPRMLEDQVHTHIITCIKCNEILLKKNGLCAIDLLITTVLIQTCLLRGKYSTSYFSMCVFLYSFSFHNKLKNNPRYLDHKVDRRLDDLLHVLFKFGSDVYIAGKTKYKEVAN